MSVQTCHATQANYEHCKYSTNRGWCDTSRYAELFGTPARAASTLLDVCDNCGQDECSGCQVYELTRGGDLDYDALIEWLRGDAE